MMILFTDKLLTLPLVYHLFNHPKCTTIILKYKWGSVLEIYFLYTIDKLKSSNLVWSSIQLVYFLDVYKY